MAKNLLRILIFLALIINFNCKEKHLPEKQERKLTKSQQIKLDKQFLEEDMERIESFIKRKGWNMQYDSLGFWYEIYEKGNGQKVKPGQIITIKYRIELLDGTVCYTSDSLGNKTFKVQYGDVINGLNRAATLLSLGDKARFIFPPNWAYGILGDQEKIPMRSSIVYYIEVVDIQNNN